MRYVYNLLLENKILPQCETLDTFFKTWNTKWSHSFAKLSSLTKQFLAARGKIGPTHVWSYCYSIFKTLFNVIHTDT